MDTPGLRQFELWGVVPGELEAYFVEFRPFIPHCRFPDCSHTHEHGCAVKDAVYWGQIHPGRFESYRKLYHQQPLPGGLKRAEDHRDANPGRERPARRSGLGPAGRRSPSPI